MNPRTVRLLLLVLVAVALYHFWQVRQGNLQGMPHRARPGPGRANPPGAQGAMGY